jgi:hypothetical protein
MHLERKFEALAMLRGYENCNKFCGVGLCCCLAEFWYYSYSRNHTGQEFFVPAQTLIAVKLLT